MHIRILNRKVEKELDELGGEARALFGGTVEKMLKHGTYALGMPHVRKIQGALWEIRLSDQQGIARVIFATMVKDTIVVLHAFRKKTQKTPQSAIDLALKRLKEI